MSIRNSSYVENVKQSSTKTNYIDAHTSSRLNQVTQGSVKMSRLRVPMLPWVGELHGRKNASDS